MFLDSNIFLNAYLSPAPNGKACFNLLKKINSGEQNATTSPLVLDEVLYIALGKKDHEFAQYVWNNMHNIKNLTFLPIDMKVTAHVMHYVKSGLQPRDAFHAATMKANGISIICSYDKSFDGIKGIKRQTPK